MKPALCIQPRPQRQRGVTLIEVLIAVLLFSFGILGLVGLQARATQVSVGAEDTSRAALLANEIVTTMWTEGSASLPSGTISAWNARVANAASGGLPNATGTVTEASGVATVTVTWRPPAASSTVSHRYQTQVLVP